MISVERRNLNVKITHRSMHGKQSVQVTAEFKSSP